MRVKMFIVLSFNCTSNFSAPKANLRQRIMKCGIDCLLGVLSFTVLHVLSYVFLLFYIFILKDDIRHIFLLLFV